MSPAKQSASRPRLTPKQRALIEAMFCKGINIEDAMQNCDVRMRIFDNWLRQPYFRQELHKRLESCRLQAQIDSLLVLPDAARNLFNVTKSDQDHISYAASRDFIHLTQWINRLPNPLGDDSKTASPAAFEALETLLKTTDPEHKNCE